MKIARTLLILLAVGCCASPAFAVSIPLQNGVATFSQTSFPASSAIDGNFGGARVFNGWALSPDQTSDQKAAFQTAATVPSGGAGTALTFTLYNDFTSSEIIGDFKIEVTNAPQSTFATNGQQGPNNPNTGPAGDVGADAIWTTLVPQSVIATNGLLYTINPNGSIVANTTTTPDTSDITVTAISGLAGITGIRLEAIPNSGFPSHGSGLASDGNFVVQEITLSATALVPEPSAFVLLGLACVGMTGWSLRGRRRGRRS